MDILRLIQEFISAPPFILSYATAGSRLISSVWQDVMISERRSPRSFHRKQTRFRFRLASFHDLSNPLMDTQNGERLRNHQDIPYFSQNLMTSRV